jgi:hypothetical protein
MVGVFQPRWKSAAAGVMVLVSVLALMAGCGKGAYTYVADQNEKTYFKVPSGWSEVDPGVINEYFLGHIFGVASDSQFATDFHRLSWTHAYDEDSDPTADHFVSYYPNARPLVYSLVTPVPPDLQSALSFDLLRNLFFPVTDRMRQAAAQNNELLPGFELLNDEIITRDGGLHGVRVVYNYLFQTQITEATHTIDMTALTNQDASVLYLFIIRCTAECYRKRAVEFNDVATSFTVGSKA